MERRVQIYILNKREEELINSENDINALADRLTRFIIDYYQLKFIKSIVYTNYTDLNQKEQMFVIGECEKNLKEQEKIIFSAIYNPLSDFLKKENKINLEGFIRFRLNEYKSFLYKSIEASVNEYINQCEYNEFINGLILYLEFQTPLIDTIKISALKEMYRITDLIGKEILNLFEYDDLLLDVILTLAPNKIIICNIEDFNNKELLQTILNIFKKRVVLAEISENSKIYASKVDKE